MMGTKKRLVFVDDEPNILQGLKRMLRGQRDAWDMAFVRGGVEALARMAEQSVDVVVTDMRMPGMDGAQLLSEVMRRHPEVIRVVLSGHSDLECIMKAVGPTHQYLTKPCDVDKLIITVERALALRDLLTDEKLRSLVTSLERLPSLPALYQEIVRALRSEETSLSAVGEIIGRDPAMTAKILQLVNSAFFGLGRPVSTASQAVSYLGLDTVRALVLSVNVFGQFDAATITAFSLESLWTHSLSVGTLAKAIAVLEKASKRTCEDSLLAGLLHDVGKLILVSNLPHRYSQAEALASHAAITVDEAQREIFGSSHMEVGAYLLGLWGLGDDIVEAVAFHHHPSACIVREFTPLTAVHSANALDAVVPPDSRARSPHPIDLAHLERLGLVDRLPEWQAMCRYPREGGDG